MTTTDGPVPAAPAQSAGGGPAVGYYGVPRVAPDAAPIDGQPHLTPREHQVMTHLSRGALDKEIAELLRISVWTVHNHLKNIYEKLGVQNRTEAVMEYLQK